MQTFKLPDRWRYDSYSRFYANLNRHGVSIHYNAPAIVFETSELVITDAAYDACNRGLWNEMSIGTYLTTDSECPTLFWRGKPVPKAWLDNNGAQRLLVDWEQGYAIGAYVHRRANADTRIPVWIREKIPRIGVYSPGPGSPPLGDKISLQMPANRYFSKPEMDHIKDLHVAAKALYELQGRPAPSRMKYGPTGKPVDPQMLIECESAGDMHPDRLAQLAINGVGRAHIFVDRLTVGARRV